MVARKHHYVPQCYLKGFSSRRNKPKLYVVDASQSRSFRTSPSQVAAERDFHRVDLEGVPIDAFENALAAFESELSLALNRIIEARSIRNHSDKITLLNLVTLVAIKNPRFRAIATAAREQSMNIALDLMTASPEQWASTKTRAEAEGFVDKGIDIAHREARAFYEKGQFRFKVPAIEHLRVEMAIFEKILPMVLARKWMLFKAPVDSTAFVTSDHPSCLLWTDPRDRGGVYPPGLGLKGTTLFFPVSNGLAIMGMFEGQEREIDATPQQIAQINGAIIAFAERQIYAKDSDFLYSMQPGEKLKHGDWLAFDPRFVLRKAN